MRKKLYTLATSIALLLTPSTGYSTSLFESFNGDLSHLTTPQSGEFGIQISTTFSNAESGFSALQTVAPASFAEIFKQQTPSGTKTPSLVSIEQAYATQDPRYTKLSLTARADALAKYIQSSYSVVIPSGSILASLTIKQITQNPGDIEGITRQVRDQLSLGQKIQIASHFGGAFANDYNYDRISKNNPQGYVTLEGLISALSTDEKGGVCRDIALAQGHLLNYLGVPADNIYTMAYQNATAHHAVLIVQDPESEQIIKINYATVGVSSQAGSSGLYIDGKHQATGIEYKFYDINGKPVQSQRTALGRLLSDMTGGQPVFADSLAPYSVARVAMITRWGEAVVFTGQLADSTDKVTGVAFHSMDVSRLFGGVTKLGVAIIDRNSKNKDYSINQQGLFLNLQSMVTEKKFTIGPVMATIQAGVEGQFAIFNNQITTKDTQTSAVKYDFQTNGFVGLNLENGNTEAGILAVGYLDFKHVAKAHSGGYKMSLNHIRMHIGTKRMVGKDVLVSGKAFLTLREVGNTLNFEASVSKNQKSVVVNYQKPLDQIPYFFDGSTEVVRVGGQTTKSSGKKSKTSYVDLRYDKDQKTAQAGFGISWRW